MPATPLQLRINLTELWQREPTTAQYGQWLNNNATSGVDLDGDLASLSWDEFVQGSQRMMTAFAGDPGVQANVMRLHELFMQQQGGAAQDWTGVLAVEFPVSEPKAGAAKGFGGFTLQKLQPTGIVRVAMPLPTPTTLQRVDAAALQLKLVDDEGQPLTTAIIGTRLDTTNPEKHLLLVDLDLQKLSDNAHIRWELPVMVSDALIDLTTPVPLSALAALPDDTKQWLGGAPMIQIEHPLLQDLAAKARNGATDVQSLVKNTLQIMDGLRRYDWQAADPNWQNDALSLAQSGFGECVANSNLFAALMRINGVPTRIVSGIVRGNGWPINMHYRNEYFVPGKGWVYVEPQGLQIQLSRVGMIETGRISSRMEQSGNGFDRYQGVIAGTMIATEINRDGALVSDPKVVITAGLFTRTPAIAGAHLALHGAN